MEDGGIEVRILGPGDEPVLGQRCTGVFDKAANPALTREFLSDAHHHLAVALDAGVVVAVASAVDYVHPGKPRELWINEVCVAATHRRRGIAARLLWVQFEHGRGLGCRQAWVLTNRSNVAATRLYDKVRGVVDADDTDDVHVRPARPVTFAPILCP